MNNYEPCSFLHGKSTIYCLSGTVEVVYHLLHFFEYDAKIRDCFQLGALSTANIHLELLRLLATNWCRLRTNWCHDGHVFFGAEDIDELMRKSAD